MITDSLISQQQVPIFAAYLYDAVRIYIDAIEEVLRLNGSVSNGSAVVGVMRDRTYRSKRKYNPYMWTNITFLGIQKYSIALNAIRVICYSLKNHHSIYFST